MIIYYRISDGSYKKDRSPNATKECCLSNFLTTWKFGSTNTEDTFVLIQDNLSAETQHMCDRLLNGIRHTPIITDETRVGGSGSATFRIAAILSQELPDDTIVYFLEDDYLHVTGARDVLLEGIKHADYVTLYLHPDKFIPASQGGNPEVDDAGSTLTRIFKTEKAFWMMCNSTTMTFATTVGVMKKDYKIWEKWTESPYPQDFNAFLELREKNRTLIQPIPTWATHGETSWQAPLIGTGITSWNDV